MPGFQFVASLVDSLAWPVAVVVAVVALRRPLAAAMGRAKRVEAAGVALELAEVEHARESVEQDLAQASAEGASLGAAEVDELVGKAADLGWYLGRMMPELSPDVVVDRSGDKPVVRSETEKRIRKLLARDFEPTHPRWRTWL
ncbi:hypothetical protein GBF35_25830 [Nonomuraea phyllanthi]|uniref:hypothetical protein n=1 Tax=Nonomuraea phyllanthi TaxID=2219224 RepID=UPI001293D969|nr:hypothetical protein [Nonomuraea phyllanthi]QFY09617.1 hypothetical protein GBF35_25830 [Nonomuraea phyllanthi]